MLLRQDGDGFIAITQPAHAWLSGQMARAWGNDTVGFVEPFQETCLGAEQHDCGWLEWESRPALNPETGRPLAFFEVPVSDHLKIWRSGPALAAIQSPYAGLLVSLHGTGLYARYRSDSNDPEVKSFMAAETARQAEIIQTLAQDPSRAAYLTPEALKRNQALLAVWDLLSLHLCLKGAPRRLVQDVPARERTIDIQLKRVEGETWTLDPWPFRDDVGVFIVAGRRIPPKLTSQEEMRAVLAGAPLIDIEFRFERAGAA